MVRPLLVLLPLTLSISYVHAAFPTSFGGCFSPPSVKGINITSSSIPSNIASVLETANVMVRQVQEQGIDLVDSGLWTTPTSSIAVGVVYDQELIWSQGYGNTGEGGGAPTNIVSSVVNADTIFRIGSISKVLAMLSMMSARDAGHISLDDPISKHVPAFSVKPPPPGSGLGTGSGRTGVTFASLASHLAGLTRESPCSNQQCVMDDEEAFRRIAETMQILPANTMSIYSNLGFEVLGHATKIGKVSCHCSVLSCH